MGDGVNIGYHHLTEEIVEFLHYHGKLVMVWIDVRYVTENIELYLKLLNMGIDSFCTDFPLDVIWV